MPGSCRCQTPTVGLVAVEGLDGEQEVLVLQVLDLREDGLELRARGRVLALGKGWGGRLPACCTISPSPFSPWAAAGTTTEPSRS